MSEQPPVIQARCAFCLNTPAANSVKAGKSGTQSAYLCDDCQKTMDSERRYPKFAHKTEGSKVTEVDLEEEITVTPGAPPSA